MESSDNSDVIYTIKTLFEQQLQKTINVQHGLLNQLYQQLEAFITISTLLDIQYPLPPMRGWAASPDFLVLVIGEILSRKQCVIVELGSGVSTLVSAYALQKTGKGKMISIDHDSAFMDKTATQLRLHGLENLVTLVHAPLRNTRVGGKEYDWYDIPSTEIPDDIDILVIDGPPGEANSRSRYPALPVLVNSLSNDAVVYLDDAVRPGEKMIASEWSALYPEFKLEQINCEKGAAVFRRQKHVT